MTTAIPRYIATDADKLAECGWRTEDILQPDGSILLVKVPLTPEEFLHPQEGFHF